MSPYYFLVNVVLFFLFRSSEYYGGYTNGQLPAGSADSTAACMTGNCSKDCKEFEKCCEEYCGIDNGFLVTCSMGTGSTVGVANTTRCACAAGPQPAASPPRPPGPQPPRPPGPQPPSTTVPPAEPECGRPKVRSRGRIVGGKEAIPHSWPWQISLRITDFAPGTNGMHICGGSIVNRYYVITAAHCLERSNNSAHYRVLAGLHNYRTPEPYIQAVDVANLTIHPDFQKRHEYSNDLAVLRLAEPLEFHRNVSAVCLPVDEVKSDEPCVVTGWGDTKGTANNRYLQQVVVPTIAAEICNSSAQYDGQIDQSMLCAAGDGTDACSGDSGGPLVCLTHDRKWELQGVVSWGEDCAVADKPRVYTRVASFKKWMDKILFDTD